MMRERDGHLHDWLAYIESLHQHTIALGLDRVQQVKQALGVIQTVPVIMVGGTNGKGSTCAMLESILQAAAYRVGLYTSPHLLHYNERVRVNGVPASNDMLCHAFERVESARQTQGKIRGNIPLTYFEFGTLAAWEVFVQAKLDVIILEVGMGGRLDAVNAFDADCAIVTSIDLDHREYLGHTREAIGFEKAGIFRAGKPAIVADPYPPESVLEHAHSVKAELKLIGKDFGYQTSENPRQWRYWDPHRHYTGLAYPALRGAIQLANASTAIAALNALASRLPVSSQEIRRGLANVELPGRFQVLPGRPTVVLDVAHNPQAAATLGAHLDSMGFYSKTWAVCGMLQDKDIAAVVDTLKGKIDYWLPATLASPRGASACQLAAVLAQKGIPVEKMFDSPFEAYQWGKSNMQENDRILIFGSFLTVADILRTII